jgi:hypothetical protein
MTPRRYRKIIADYRKWVAREQNGDANFVPKEYQQIRDSMQRADSDKECRFIALRFGYISNWHAHWAVPEIADGYTGAWGTLAAAAYWKYWQQRILCISFEREVNKRGVAYMPSNLDVGLEVLFCFAPMHRTKIGGLVSTPCGAKHFEG